MIFFCINLNETQAQNLREQASGDVEFVYLSEQDDYLEIFKQYSGGHVVVVSLTNKEFLAEWKSSLSLKFPSFQLQYIENKLSLSLMGIDNAELDLSLGDMPALGGVDLSMELDESGLMDSHDDGLDLGLDGDINAGIELGVGDLSHDSLEHHDSGDLESLADSGLELSLDSLDDSAFELGQENELSIGEGRELVDDGLSLTLDNYESEKESEDLVEESLLALDDLSLTEDTGEGAVGEEFLDLSLDLDLSADSKEHVEVGETATIKIEQKNSKKEQLSIDSLDSSALFDGMGDLTGKDFSIGDIESSLDAGNVPEGCNLESGLSTQSKVKENIDDDLVGVSDVGDDIAFEASDKIEKLPGLVSENLSKSVIAASAVSVDSFSGKDLEGYSQTIRELREDRERLLSRVEDLELLKDSTKKKHLGIEAMLEEKKIELDIAKSRFKEDFEKISRKLESLKSNENLARDKNIELQEEIEKLNKKTFLDMRKVQLREKELSSQLGLLRTDTENQIRNRDIIILDLKRKIDILEYDIEQSWKQEKAAKKEKLILQSKIDRLVGSLKDVVESLHEDDIDSWLNKIEKK